MKKNSLIIISIIAILTVCIGCENKNGASYPGYENGFYPSGSSGVPRLVINGQISNTNNEVLSGIYISVFGVRQEDEADIMTYNYAVSDSLGKYTIIRYRGRELPTELTLVATDSTGLYQEQSRICEITYDSVYSEIERRKIPYNGFVTADFVLSQ